MLSRFGIRSLRPVATALRSSSTAMARASRALPRRQLLPALGVRGLASIGPASASTDMFCFQCEQTEHNRGCTTVGVCGKTPEVSAMQDLLVHAVKGISQYAARAARLGHSNPELDHFVLESLFSTLTNVNFDKDRFTGYLQQAHEWQSRIKEEYITVARAQGAAAEVLDSPFATWTPAGRTADELEEQGRQIGLISRRDTNEDILSLQELMTYGIKGVAAYAHHAWALGKSDPALSQQLYECFDYVARPVSEQRLEELLGLCLKVGEANVRAMQLLDAGHTERFGHPEPSRVPLAPVPGKCLLVSGHDMRDLEAILQLTEGTGVNVYTHGEMLPAHGYPGLRKYKHLVGNYGGAWQLQKFEFGEFPGPVLVTTNCIMEPRKSYRDRLFTTNAVGWTGVRHLADRDFRPVVEAALACEGFTEEDCEEQEDKFTMTGFGHNAVLSVADKVVDLVKGGKIKNFFLIGGCDGTEGERSYYKYLATGLPKDAVVLTLGCAKYRFNKFFESFGNVEGTQLPRMMDMGQCNDAYSAVQVALGLAKAFNTDVNKLPLHLVLSWFEQKAVAVLLSLLHLGIRDIRVGPNLPAFVSPNVLNVLVDKYNLTPIGTDAEKDMRAMLGK